MATRTREPHPSAGEEAGSTVALAVSPRGVLHLDPRAPDAGRVPARLAEAFARGPGAGPLAARIGRARHGAPAVARVRPRSRQALLHAALRRGRPRGEPRGPRSPGAARRARRARRRGAADARRRVPLGRGARRRVVGSGGRGPARARRLRGPRAAVPPRQEPAVERGRAGPLSPRREQGQRARAVRVHGHVRHERVAARRACSTPRSAAPSSSTPARPTRP